MPTEGCFPRTARRPVRSSAVYLVIADISGYTQFLQEHQNNIAHAERIVAELLESVIGVVRPPLTVHELMGDAVSFYALADEDTKTPADILEQVYAVFRAFNEKMKEIIRCRAVMECPACLNVQELKLKIIVHVGDAVLTEVGGFRKIAGPAMILAHRLLKNSVQEEEYLLVTSDFYNRCEERLWERALWKSEYCKDFGDVLILVQFPMSVIPRLSSANAPHASDRTSKLRQIEMRKRRRKTKAVLT